MASDCRAVASSDTAIASSDGTRTVCYSSCEFVWVLREIAQNSSLKFLPVTVTPHTRRFTSVSFTVSDGFSKQTLWQLKARNNVSTVAAVVATDYANESLGASRLLLVCWNVTAFLAIVDRLGVPSVRVPARSRTPHIRS